MPTHREIALAAFDEIQARHPALTMRLDRNPRNVDLEVEIPAQDQLQFDVSLNLQFDELHLHAGGFSCEWFPCTKSRVVSEYIEAVSGLLAGRFRILEYRRRERLVKAYLQRPIGSRWENVARYHIGWSWWLRTEVRVLQNEAG
jgi:hypothetical protein